MILGLFILLRLWKRRKEKYYHLCVVTSWHTCSLHFSAEESCSPQSALAQNRIKLLGSKNDFHLVVKCIMRNRSSLREIDHKYMSHVPETEACTLQALLLTLSRKQKAQRPVSFFRACRTFGEDATWRSLNLLAKALPSSPPLSQIKPAKLKRSADTLL